MSGLGPAGRVVRLIALLVALPAAVVLAWEALSRASASLYLPSPFTVAKRSRELWLSGPWEHAFLGRAFLDQAVPSLARLALGFGLAVTLGSAAGLVLGLRPALGPYLDPVLAFARAVPTPLLLGAVVVVAGTGDAPKIAIIAFGAVWPVLLATAAGAAEVDPGAVDAARVSRLTGRQVLTRVVIPACGPRWFAGVRTSLSIAVVLLVVSELVGASSGVGFFLLQAQRGFQVVDLWSALVLLAVLGAALNGVVALAQRWVLPWQGS